MSFINAIYDVVGGSLFQARWAEGPVYLLVLYVSKYVANSVTILFSEIFKKWVTHATIVANAELHNRA